MSSACPFHANCRVMPSLMDELMPSSTGGPSGGVVASGTASLTFAAHSADQHASGGGGGAGGYTRRLTSPLRAFGRRLRQQSTKVDESDDADAADGAIRTSKRASSIYTTAAVNDELEQQQQPRRPKLATRIQWCHDLTVVAPRDEACLLDANGVERVRQKLARIQWSEDLTAVPPPSGHKTEPEAEQAADEPQHLQVEAAVHDEEDEEEEEDLPLPFHPLEEALLQAPEASKNGSTRMSKSRSLQEMLRHYWGMGRHHAPAAAAPEQSSTTTNGGIGTLAWKESQRRRSRRAALSGTCAIGMPRARSTDERLFAALATHTQQLGLPPLLSLRSSQSNMFQAIQEEKAMLQAPTAPIDASKFVAYVQERRKKRILFKGEFLMIQRSVDPQRCTTEVGVRMGERNQYPDTLPYDHNRVVLELRPGVDDSHYINASYVNSWLREKAYVVTQSVRSKQASNELWRTVWELGANTMVMLTKIFDFMRVMCLQYWPQTHFQFGEIHVETMETQTYAHFVIRTFRLRKTCGPEASADGTATAADAAAAAAAGAAPCEEQRIVKHFHFTEWELNSFPYISAFIELRRRVRQWMERSPVDAPIVVHCSNGGGRSGAFLALDANLELLQRTGQLDVYEYGRTLANSRQHLVDTVDQYMFIYDVLCEAVLCSLQPIGMHQLKNRSGMYKARKDRELMEVQDSHENKLLLMLTAPLRIGDCAGGHRLENRGKNRDVMVVPPDHARPYLQTLHGESKDYTYINAVEVDGFTRKSEFIVTEWPKVPTLDSFWTLVFDHNVHTVICLTNQPTDIKQYPQFVHNKGKRNYGPFTVEIVNYQQYPGLQSHMVKISKRPTEPVTMNSQPNPEKGANKKLTFMISEIMATGASQQQLEAEVRLCCIIQVKMWPMENKVPLSTTALIEVLKMTRSWRKRAPDRPEQRPTIVMSHNGVSRCGIFIAANVCIDQMEMDHEVDVFHAVKMIRLNRPQLIDMKDEYKYLYDLMLHWYMTSPELRQFEPPEMSVVSDAEEEASDGDASLGGGAPLMTRSQGGSTRRRPGSIRHDGQSLARSKSNRASSRHGSKSAAAVSIQRVPTINSGTNNNNTLAVSGGALARNASSMSGTSAGSRKREPVYLN